MPEEKQYYSLITNVGLEKLAKATHDGTKINITKYALGDGNGEYVPVTADMTSLVNQCYESDIQGYEIDKEDTNQIIIRCLVPSEVGYFVLREWGLFDDEGDLIAVANTTDTELVPYSSGELLNLYLRIYIQFGNLDTVNIVAEPASEEIIEQEVLKFIDDRISPYDERINSALEKADSLEKRIDTTDGNVEQNEGRIQELENNAQNYLTKSEASETYLVEADLSEIYNRLQTIETTLDGVAEFLEGKI